MKTTRTQRFYAGQLVTDLEGWLLMIEAVRLDPIAVKGYEHCGGSSARYEVRFALDITPPEGLDFTIRYDWELKLFTN
jgi:hypothetical protein